MRPKLSVLELYSGIGGMHWALKECGVDHEVVLAVDINTTVNGIYKHNFPSTNLQSFSLEKLTLEKLESLKINTILMSPPCQPFTRVGKKGDCQDVRTKSFLHILRLLDEMKVKPEYLLVENVKGFEVSQTRKELVSCLERCGYVYQEFLLTPLQFGIPNCRLRYYLTARRGKNFAFNVQSQVRSAQHASIENVNWSQQHCSNTINETRCSEHIQKKTVDSDGSSVVSSEGPHTRHPDSCPNETGHLNSHTGAGPLEVSQDDIEAARGNSFALRDAGRNMRYCEDDDDVINAGSKPLWQFMEHLSRDELADYWLSDKELRLFVIMDIVFPALKKSICFTKRYGHYVDGAGSVVQMTTNVEDVRAASEFKSCVVKLKNRTEWGEAELYILRKLQLRYFTPREVANLLCFPPQLEFPPGLSRIQKYRVLGNSLNVHVVAELIKLMTQEVTT
ncbi:unnamed protein product [Candidula unifasciata]|uniref:tRNA (cytosine(38)-C(5))-methyltransferase n=1 Tax=Candidula unifasciata TaxID=100452 RepID=A0A8S3ZT43_9EUPU|nr:unnamed protein product [Candidula unifasciata]